MASHHDRRPSVQELQRVQRTATASTHSRQQPLQRQPHQMLTLQRTVGNQAVQRMLLFKKEPVFDPYSVPTRVQVEQEAGENKKTPNDEIETTYDHIVKGLDEYHAMPVALDYQGVQNRTRHLQQTILLIDTWLGRHAWPIARRKALKSLRICLNTEQGNQMNYAKGNIKTEKADQLQKELSRINMKNGTFLDKSCKFAEDENAWTKIVNQSVKEYSSDNIVCWLDIQSFKKNHSLKAAQEFWRKYIGDTYTPDSGVSDNENTLRQLQSRPIIEINFSSKTVQQVADMMKKSITSDTLKSAETELLKNLLDTWDRVPKDTILQ